MMKEERANNEKKKLKELSDKVFKTYRYKMNAATRYKKNSKILGILSPIYSLSLVLFLMNVVVFSDL